MTSRHFRLCALTALALVLGACVRGFPDTLPVAPASNSAEANDTWERFASLAERAENTAAPFRASGTLYYTGKEDSQRVSVYFWGNGGRESMLPLRLDILMGHGNVLGRAREDERGFRVYVPMEDTVFTHQDSGGLLAFGVPFPFTLSELAALVTGRYAKAFTAPGNDIAMHVPQAFDGPSKSFIYEIQDAPISGFLSVSSAGLPLSWREKADNGWKLTIEYWPDSTRPTPRKLHIQHGSGNEATLIVRELASPAPFTPDQLSLAVPAGAKVSPLADPAPAKVENAAAKPKPTRTNQ